MENKAISFPIDEKSQQKAVEEQLMPASELIGILFTPSPYKWLEYEVPRKKFGVCRFCGQYSTTYYYTVGEDEANESATLVCSCAGAKNYRDQQEWLLRRSENLALARVKIDDYFGSGSDYRGWEPMNEKTIHQLETLVEMVYDRLLGKLTVNLTPQVKAIITPKDTDIIIERKNADGDKTKISAI